ncbi:prefoldin subunit beta [Candidatus Woesearchaeota archaeon]|nr:prefoldin subunit beta [Candidatus Woesearchaeota archaeon]
MPDKKEMEEKMSQLQLLEQNMQALVTQKQQFQSQLNEIESALEELGKSQESYKMVGNIMVKSDKKDLEEDLKKKKEVAELRIKTIEKQEASLKEKAQKTQTEVLGNIKEKE